MKSMRLYSSAHAGKRTFMAMPVNMECPFSELVFVPADENKEMPAFLMVMSKTKEKFFQMMPKLNDCGKPISVGKSIKTERLLVEKNKEYDLLDYDEIVEFINEVCINADTFDFHKYMPSKKEMFFEQLEQTKNEK